MGLVGNETISHLRENGRITVMFIAFDGPPRIVRLWGTGTLSAFAANELIKYLCIFVSTVGSVHEYGTSEYDNLIPPETRKPGSRAAIVVDIHKVGSVSSFTIVMFSQLTVNIVVRLHHPILRLSREPNASVRKYVT